MKPHNLLHNLTHRTTQNFEEQFYSLNYRSKEEGQTNGGALVSYAKPIKQSGPSVKLSGKKTALCLS